MKKNMIVGMAEVIDNEGNILTEVEIVIHEDLEKANFWNYLSKNLRLITSGR